MIATSSAASALWSRGAVTMVRLRSSFLKLPATVHSVPVLLTVMLPRPLLLAKLAHISIDSQADADAHVAAASECP